MLLEIVAERLGDSLRDELVFVGGAIVGLLTTDPGAPSIRTTNDVALICKAVVRADFHRVEGELRKLGFVHDVSPQAPICRWRVSSVAVDVMPTLENILGFSNPWYPLAMDTATRIALPSGREIRLITAPVYLATKLEAFDGRGNGDYLSSHDLGDLIAVVDGRSELPKECRQSPEELRAYLSRRLSGLLATPSFLEALPGHLPTDSASQERLPSLEARLWEIAALISG